MSEKSVLLADVLATFCVPHKIPSTNATHARPIYECITAHRQWPY